MKLTNKIEDLNSPLWLFYV